MNTLYQLTKNSIDFTRKEFEILKELLAHPGYVQTREDAFR